MPPFFHMKIFSNKKDVSEFNVEEYSRKYMAALKTPNPRYIAAKEKALIKALEEQGLLSKDELKQSQDPNHTGGRKFDGDKLEYGLLPPLALQEVVKVLTFGAKKYEPDNWKHVPDAHRRYFNAAQRHMWAYKMGEMNDPETGINHMAHAICCLMFMVDLDEQKPEVLSHETIEALNNPTVRKILEGEK